MSKPIVWCICARSKRRGCSEFVEMLRDHPVLRELGYEVLGPTTNPGKVEIDRGSLLREDKFLEEKAKNPESIFIIFGGDGSRNALKYYGKLGNTCLIQTTHDFGVSKDLGTRMGFDSGVYALVDALEPFFIPNQQRMGIVPGRDKRGAAWQTTKILKSKLPNPNLRCVSTKYELTKALEEGFSVICSESIAEFYGHDMSKSVTSFDLVKALTEYRVNLQPKAIRRITGPELEELPYTLSEWEQEHVQKVLDTFARVMPMIHKGYFDGLGDHRRFVMQYEPNACSVNLTEIANRL